MPGCQFKVSGPGCKTIHRRGVSVFLFFVFFEDLKGLGMQCSFQHLELRSLEVRLECLQGSKFSNRRIAAEKSEAWSGVFRFVNIC